MPEMSDYTPGTPSWVDLGTPDLAGATAFYGGLFGWDVFDAGPDGGGYAMAYLRDKPVAGLGPQQNPGPPYWTTYVSVADADETAAKVKDAGGMTFVEPMDVLTVGRMAVFADPTGAAFAIWQPRDHKGAGLVNEHGTLSWNELATRDVEAAKAFYTAVFGWEAETHAGGPEGGYTEWQLDGRSIGGMMAMPPQMPAEVPAHWLVYFATDDCDATVAKATELGGQVRMPAMDIEPGRFAVLADPQGATFAVITMRQT